MNENETKDEGSMSRLLIPALLVIGALVAIAVIIMLPPKQTQAKQTAAPPVNVEVQTVAAVPELADRFQLPAVVEPNRVVRVAAEVSGRIERLPIEEGAACKEGDVLVELNTDLLKADRDSAAAMEKNSTARYNRIYNLNKEGAATPRELDQAESEMATGKAALQAAEARLVRSKIIAPIAGVLNKQPVEKGEYVQPGTCVAEIVDLATAKVVANVPERDIQFLQLGQQVAITAEVKGVKKEFPGTITYVSALADNQTRTTRVEATVDNYQRLLPSGHIVDATFTRKTLKDAVLIPLAAVIPLENGKAVYVVNGGKAHRRDVELGIIRGDKVQVLSGLASGDKLIVAGHRFVGPGQQVQVVQQRKDSK